MYYVYILQCGDGTYYTGSTTDLERRLDAHANGRGILLMGGITWALKLLSHATGMVDKAFGSLCYDMEMSRYQKDYCVKTLAESIWETEKQE